MKNIVLIPVWRRADFLAVTLEHLQNANQSDKYCYIFLIDRGYKGEVIDVINNFPLCKELRYTPRHSFHGNTYNILDGYRFALDVSKDCGSKLIYLVEEDIWVAKDFFDFHETVQEQFDSFCVSAVRCQNDAGAREPDPSLIHSHETFQSLGISWKEENLKRILVHANQSYYRNMKGYLKARFPQSKYGASWSEQDGLINRVAESTKIPCLYPHVPRAFHSGFVGYNRRGRPLEGDLAERIKKLKTMSKDDMNARAEVYKDIDIIDCSMDYGIKSFALKEIR